MRVVLSAMLGLLVFALALPLCRGIAGVYDGPASFMVLRWLLSSLLATLPTGALAWRF